MLQDRFLERARHARPWATVALATIAAAFLATSPAPAAAQVGLATLRLGAWRWVALVAIFEAL